MARGISWMEGYVFSISFLLYIQHMKGQVVNVDADDLLARKSYFERVPVTNEFELEGIPNRDSLAYGGLYGIEGARTILRGTLRCMGCFFFIYFSCLPRLLNLGVLQIPRFCFSYVGLQTAWAARDDAQDPPAKVDGCGSAGSGDATWHTGQRQRCG